VVGEGVPILLVPPSGATASTWGGVSEELARIGRVLAYDRRGYARSGGEPVRSMSIHTADAAALLELLRTAPAFVVGTSAGAAIGYDLAVRRPDLVRVVVAHEFPWRFTRHLPTASQITALAKIGSLALRGRHADATEVLLRATYTYPDGGSAWAETRVSDRGSVTLEVAVQGRARAGETSRPERRVCADTFRSLLSSPVPPCTSRGARRSRASRPGTRTSRMSAARLDGWRSVQERGEDGAIESDERVSASRAVVPATKAGILAERYWLTVRQASFGLVRLRETRDGSVLHLAGAPLLRFAPAELAAGASCVGCSFPIRGGLLARRAGGALVLSQSNRTELRAALTGFVPRLATRPYDGIERRIHVAISRRFFRTLIGE
jgi:pimeloyl-ACP methyl ester carboxylesterase